MVPTLPTLGVGLGYRRHLHSQTVKNRSSIDFLELITDQFIYSPDEKIETLWTDLQEFPVVPHSVGLSIGTDVVPDDDYLERTARFITLFEAPWYSEHLSFTKVPEVEIGQLTPLWFTSEVVEVVCRNVKRVKERIPVPFLLENVTYYFPIPDSEMSEAEFITRVLEKTDCGLLLDVNNVYVNSRNHGYDPYDFMNSIPLDRTVQVHIGGHRMESGLMIDSHADRTSTEVLSILEYVVRHAPVKAVSLEWDENFPSDFGVLLQELEAARAVFSPDLQVARAEPGH